MAKSDIEVIVKNEYIQRVEGEPGSLFVMKLSQNVTNSTYSYIHKSVELQLKEFFPGSQLLLLPCEIDTIRQLSEDDLNKAGYFKKEVD